MRSPSSDPSASSRADDAATRPFSRPLPRPFPLLSRRVSPVHASISHPASTPLFPVSFLRLLSCCLLLTLISGCNWLSRPAGDPRRESNFQDGLRWLDQGRWLSARESFYRALEVNPQNLHAHLTLGDLYQTRLTNQVLALYHYHRYLEVGRLQNGGNYHDQSASDGIRNAEVDLARRYGERMFRDQQQFELDNVRRTNAFLLQRIDVLNHHVALLSRQIASQTNPAIVPPSSLNPQPLQPTTPTQPATPIATQPASNTRSVNVTPNPQSPTQSTPRVATQPVTPAPAPTPRSHKIQSGDSLGAIARKYKVTLPALQAANPDVDSRRLKVGQLLVIPPR